MEIGSPVELAAVARAVKKECKPAAKIFSKVGWSAYLLQIALILHWLRETDPGKLMVEEIGGISLRQQSICSS